MYHDFENQENLSEESYSTGASQSFDPQPPSKKRTGLKTFGLIAVCVILSMTISLVSGAAGAFIVHLIRSSKENELPISFEEEIPDNTVNILQGIRDQAEINIHEIETGTKLTAAQVYAKNVNSTVGITTAVTTNFWGYQTTSAASGSGFILSEDGYILTNYHVIEDSSSITVALYDGTNYDATLVGYDQSNDIAVLKVDAQGLSPVILGDSDKLNVGDDVIAIGNPLGELTFSLTAGMVSAMDRTVTMSNGTTMNLIQTDCAINSGNSGGALFNLYGEVIGITNAKYSSSGSGASIDNIAFAIPMNGVRSIIESIIEKGYVAKPYIGISVTDVGSEYQNYGLPQGAAVRSISEDSPALAAGLQLNDIITHVDGEAVTGSSDLVSRIAASQAGQELVLTVYRQGQTLQITVTVGEQIQSTVPESNNAQTSPGMPGWN